MAESPKPQGNNLSLEIDVSYCGSDSDGFPLAPYNFSILAPYSTPLLDSIRAGLPSQLREIRPKWANSSKDIECFEGHGKGERVKVDQSPVKIPYLRDAIRNGTAPILFLTDTKTSPYHHRDSADSGRGPSVTSINAYDSKSKASDLVRRSQDRKHNGITRDSIADLVAEFQNEGQKPSRDDASILSDAERKKLPGIRQHQILKKTLTMDVMSPVKEQKTPVLHDITESCLDSDSDEVPSKPQPLTKKSAMKQKAYTWIPGATLEPPPPHGAALPQQPVHHARIRDIKLTQSCTPGPLANKSFSFDNISLLDSYPKGPKLIRQKAFRKTSSGYINLLALAPQELEIKVTTEEGDSMTLTCDAQMIVEEFRAAVATHLSSKWKAQGSDAKQFILTYTVAGTTYELVKNSQFLHDTYFYEKMLCTIEKDPPSIMVRYVSQPRQKDMKALFKISQLTRVVLDMRVFQFVEGNLPSYTLVASPDQAEVASARRTLYEFVTKVSEARNPGNYATSPEMVFSSSSISFSLKIPISNHLTIVFHYKNSFSLTKAVHINTPANKLLSEIFPCLEACKLIQDSIDNYTLQLTGEDSYIHGDHRLIYFKDIRNFICKGELINLSIVKKPCQDLYQATTLDRLKVDPNTFNSPSYRTLQDMKDPNCQASWDINDKLEVKVCHVDKLGLRQSRVYVEVSLHFGYHSLHSPLRTSVKDLVSFRAIWNEDLEFRISIKDIPKEAKILVVLTDSASNLLHWGLLTVFDHEGRLRYGEQILYLWEENDLSRTRKSSEPNHKFGPILAGPATNNPSHTAVKAVIALPDQKVFHLCTRRSRQSFMKSGIVMRNEQLRKHLAIYQLFKFVPPDSKKMPYSDLPKHLKLVNWNKLEDRLEVYNLLDELREVISEMPAHVALKLLDSDFPDTNVRSFATSILESLSDDDLYDYLLQLTQALKFEALHDSPLARFLLHRALNNKKIGHFFFWYLYCELQSPKYTPRLAVILENYLIGCGEAMLTKFKDQLEVQHILEKVGKELKEKYDKDGPAMQAALPSALITTHIDKRAFVPITNPRLTLGMMRCEKCKIMSSAKHPMWLEMLNMNRSAIFPMPVRLILKMGDDLRQDMITLRMLALFDKLWKNEGLDLNIIPYGCMATSHRSGFIEVVKNAKTIAEVSGVKGKKNLYQWIKNNQRDEFGEVDSEKLKTALQTFVHSCAGYSVATYTLGIGDRHNDNIMITTSGNLFHIDFGHFLGNIKYYMGFKREWAPFVLTPDFVYAMGGENSKTFEQYRQLCCRAFMILRRNAELIINLFSMMRWTGIPELTCVDDMDYIKNALVLDMSESDAETCFKNVVKKCIDLGWTVQIMWAFHKLKHSKTS